MYYVIMIGVLVTGFFAINGIGKVVLELYASNKLGRKVTGVLSLTSLASWYIFSYVVLTLMAFHFNSWVGWGFAVLWGIAMLVKGFGELRKDNERSMNLAHERRVESIRK